MIAKKTRLSQKDVNFLRLVYLGLTQAQAYVEAGFHAKTEKSASALSSQKLASLRNNENYQAIFRTYNPADELALDLAGLRRHQDPRIRLDATKGAAKLGGMELVEPFINLGFQVLITGRTPGEVPQGQEPVQIQAPKKTTSLLK